MKTNLTGPVEYPRLEIRKVADLVLHPDNPRVIEDAALGRLTRSMAELGNLLPIVVNRKTNRVLGGNQRLKCHLAMGQVDVQTWVVDVPEDREKLVLLALNNHAGEWDDSNLKSILAGLKEADLDLSLAGFTAEELIGLGILASPETLQPDNEPIDRLDEINRITCPQCGHSFRSA